MQSQESVVSPSFFLRSESASEWKTVVNSVSTLVEEATFEISKDGLTFRGMDPSHVSLIDILWPSSAFSKYDCPKPDKFTVRVEDFGKVIKRSDSRDSVEISRETSGSLLLRTGNQFYKREFELHLLESSASPAQLPKLTFGAKFVMSFTSFSEALSDISTISNQISIIVSGEKLSFKGSGDSGKALVSFEKGEKDELFEIQSNEKETSSTYNIEYISRIVKSMGAASTDTVRLEYSNKMPLRIEFGLGGSASKGGRIHFYLAPRVGD